MPATMAIDAPSPGGSLLGATLGGKYRMERILGEGAMGTVFRALHLQLERPVAVKVLHRSVAGNTEVQQRFRREARVVSQLRHPHIIEVHDFDHTGDGAPYLVMEYLEGEDLEQRLVKCVTLDLQEVLELFRGLCSALDHAHRQGVVHRDLKPQNIFLCQYGDALRFPKVLDFGISKLKGEQAQLTRTEAYLGTPYFMAPEQARGRSGDVDARSDVFALGAILYRVLTGSYPFVGDGLQAVLYQIVHEPPERPTLLRPGIPSAVEAVVLRALAKAREDRFPSAGALFEALERAAAGAASTSRGSLLPPGDEPTLPAAPPAPPRAGHQPAEPVARCRTTAHDEAVLLLEPRPVLQVVSESTLGSSLGERHDPGRTPGRRDRRGALVVLGILVLGGAAGGGVWFGGRGQRAQGERPAGALAAHVGPTTAPATPAGPADAGAATESAVAPPGEPGARADLDPGPTPRQGVRSAPRPRGQPRQVVAPPPGEVHPRPRPDSGRPSIRRYGEGTMPFE